MPEQSFLSAKSLFGPFLQSNHHMTCALSLPIFCAYPPPPSHLYVCLAGEEGGGREGRKRGMEGERETRREGHGGGEGRGGEGGKPGAQRVRGEPCPGPPGRATFSVGSLAPPLQKVYAFPGNCGHFQTLGGERKLRWPGGDGACVCVCVCVCVCASQEYARWAMGQDVWGVGASEGTLSSSVCICVRD